MKQQAVIFTTSGALFGLLVGWILGSQRSGAPVDIPATSVAAVGSVAQAAEPQAAGPITAPSRPDPVPLDEERERALHTVADNDRTDVASRVGLGNLYFDAGRYDRAIGWYESALALDPSDPNVSTDLAVSYYYTGQVDRALEQFQQSLDADPHHAKTLLNLGIVRAYGSRDLNGAAEAWGRLIEIAPDSAEGRAAQAALDRITRAHAS